jgi:two-component system, chemotaxis family, protein-glutamate methylesterase/glutaminase
MANIVVIGASVWWRRAAEEDRPRVARRPSGGDFCGHACLAEVPSMLPAILSRAGELEASAAEDGQPIERGRIYVAPPDLHMLVEPGVVRLTRGPRENRRRPAIDPLFRTAAHAYGPRTLGILLTGLFDDGAMGLHVIKAEGGVAIVQDPREALFPSMPGSALKNVDVDFVLYAAEIPKRFWIWLVSDGSRKVALGPKTFRGEARALKVKT